VKNNLLSCNEEKNFLFYCGKEFTPAKKRRMWKRIYSCKKEKNLENRKTFIWKQKQ
jgi:hypothetical protein